MFEAAGAHNAEGWVRSEVNEDIAQFARFTVLTRLFKEMVEPWLDAESVTKTFPVAAALHEEGASPERLARFAGAVAMNAFAAALHGVDEGHDPGGDESAPGWLLMETDSEGAVTGRAVGGLHESLFEAAPRKEEGLRLLRGDDV
jgi:hypothetical protein